MGLNMGGEMWTVKDANAAKLFCEYVYANLEAGKEVTYSIQTLTRSQQQNKAFYAMLTRLATALNDAGIEGPAHLFNAKWRQPWTKNLVKAALFDPVIESAYGKQSSSQLTVDEMSQVTEYILSEISKMFDLHIGGLSGPMGNF